MPPLKGFIMTNAQEWVDKKYLQGECINKWGRKITTRSEIEVIYLNEPTLEGELDLKDFTYWNGVKIYISPQVDETKLTFKNLPQRARIIPVIAQKYGSCIIKIR